MNMIPVNHTVSDMSNIACAIIEKENQ